MIRKYLELIRFSHTLFAMPFAILATVMAAYANKMCEPEIPLKTVSLLGILVCMIFARSAAMAFNRLVDRQIDAENPRTAGRHIPSKRLSPGSVLGFTVFCSMGFLGGTLFFLPENPIPVLMSVPVLLFLFGYSYAKRFTVLVHWWLGTALMLAPIAAWVAIRPVFSWAPVFLGLAVLFWTAGFDIIYALLDENFDRQKRIFSVPAKLGASCALKIAALSHLVMVVFLVCVPVFYRFFGLLYLSGVALISLVLAAEHLMVLPHDAKRVNLVFFWLNIFVSLTLLLFGICDILFIR